MELPISLVAWDSDKLDGELKAALPGKYLNLSSYGGGRPVIIRLDDAATSTDQATVQSICAAHDPTPLPDPLVVDLATAQTQAGANPLDGLTVAEALSWIDTNVTDLASARIALKQMVKIVAIHERRLRLIERQLGL